MSDAAIFCARCGAADTRDLARPQSVTENTAALLDPVPLKKGGSNK